MKKEKSGITLISLVVTIVVLLILAGVSINLILGENGIISKANLAVVMTENSTVLEAIKLKTTYYYMSSQNDIKLALKNDSLINEDGVVDTSTLLGHSLKTGNGSGNKDVYVVEENNLYYYEKDGTKKDLGILWNKEKNSVAETDASLFEVDDEGTLWLKDYESYYGDWATKEWTIEDLVIPKMVDGKEVKKIAFTEFDYYNKIKGWEKLKTVYIPEGVTSIGDSAFEYCSGLTSVNIPSSVTSIGDQAFYMCKELTNISINEKNTVYDSRNNCNAIIEKSSNELILGCKNTSIPDDVTSIGYGAFRECRGLTSVDIPSSVTSIGNYAFEGCSGLTSINIPSSVTSIGYGVFKDCSGLTSVDIPSSVTCIDNSAFEGCRGLTSINIPSSVTSIGHYAFEHCSGLTSVNVPSSVTSIAYTAFRSCESVTSINVDEKNTVYDSRNNCNAIIEKSSNKLILGCKNTSIPNDVTSIGNGAFEYCSGLTSVNIPSSVTSIGDHAFNSCESLTSINIPLSVTSMGIAVFWDWRNIQTINCEASSQPSGWASNWNYFCNAKVKWGVSM